PLVMRQRRDAGSCLRHSLQFGSSAACRYTCVERSTSATCSVGATARCCGVAKCSSSARAAGAAVDPLKKVFSSGNVAAAICWSWLRRRVISFCSFVRSLTMARSAAASGFMSSTGWMENSSPTSSCRKPIRAISRASCIVSLRIAAEDLLPVVLHGSVLDLQHSVALAQQVQEHRQPITPGRLQQNQKIAWIAGVAVEVALESAEASGVAREVNRMYPFP